MIRKTGAFLKPVALVGWTARHSVTFFLLGSYKDWRKQGCPMWYPRSATAYYVGDATGKKRYDEALRNGCPGPASLYASIGW